MSIDTELDISPAERRHLKVRAIILDAAEKVFAEEGEAGLSIRRLADEIDYSPAAIYRYFDSKDALVEELKEAFFERILVLIEENQRSTEPFGVRARQCVTSYIRTAIAKPYHYAAAFSGFVRDGGSISIGQTQHNADTGLGSHCDPPSDTEPYAGSNKARAFAFLVEMIATGQRGGHLRADLDPEHAAFCTWSACHGMAMIMIHTQALPVFDDGASQEALDATIAGHADIFVRGLEVPGAPAPHPANATPAFPPPGPSSQD
ncbi:MAG: helix-turn-helix domain-containing protein [Pseudomonadota bacterium]